MINTCSTYYFMSTHHIPTLIFLQTAINKLNSIPTNNQNMNCIVYTKMVLNKNDKFVWTAKGLYSNFKKNVILLYSMADMNKEFIAIEYLQINIHLYLFVFYNFMLDWLSLSLTTTRSFYVTYFIIDILDGYNYFFIIYMYIYT